MTDTKTREQELLDEFKTGLDKDGPVVLAQRVAMLENELIATGDALKLAQEDAGEAAELREQIATLTALLKDAEAERDGAIDKVKSADKARAKVERALSPAKPRKIGRITEAKQLTDDELREAIEEAERVEIAFSDGEREIADMPSVIVSGDAWKVHPRGLMLAGTVTIQGPREASSVEIAGYALLIDGKQVAWSERSDTLRVAPGQRVDLVDDIIF